MSEKPQNRQKDFTFHATNIQIDQNELNDSANGKPYLTGTFEHSKDGKTRKIVFKAFDREFESGKSVTPATDMHEKLRSVSEGYLRGTFQKNNKNPQFSEFHVAFAQTKEEREQFIEEQKAKQEAAKAAKGQDER